MAHISSYSRVLVFHQGSSGLARLRSTRGSVLLPAILAALQGIPALASLKADGDAALHGTVKEVETFFTEEERSRQHSIFSVVYAAQGSNPGLAEPRQACYSHV